MRCDNGHYYDGNVFKECPHCASGMKPIARSTFQDEEKAPPKMGGREKKKILDRIRNRWSKEHKGKTQENTGGNHTKEDRSTVKESGGTVIPEERPEVKITEGPSNEITDQKPQEIGQVTECFEEGGRNVHEEIHRGEIVTQGVDRPYIKDGTGENGEYQQEETETGDICKKNPEKESEKEMKKEAGDIGKNSTENLRKAAGQNEGKTIGFFSVGLDKEPPVGYLICIAGEDYGTGFPLKSGNNSIGRSSSMDVVILDAKVSRDKQAYVMYEPYRREFFLKPGESSGLCYLNEEVLLELKRLQAYDEILLGDTKLILIPVCGEKFSW